MPHQHFTKPTSASGYLEAMTLVILTAGISWKVVEAKWGGIREAFLGFDAEKVAAVTAENVERLMADPRVIRNRKKIDAIIDNAAKIIEMDKLHGGFDKYLAAQGDFPGKVKALKRDFSFMGDSTTYFFLAMVGDTVPDWEEHSHQH